MRTSPGWTYYDPQTQETKEIQNKRPFRILRPTEYEIIRDQAGDHQINLDALLLTGLRYEEAQLLQKNPEWFDKESGFIHVPESKAKRQKDQMERFVRLSNLGKHMVPLFFKTTPLPSRWAWYKNLKRWAKKEGLDPKGIGAKITRKTWESWLIYYYPNRISDIMFSQGHTLITSIKHYQGLPFTEEEKKKIEKYVAGWI